MRIAIVILNWNGKDLLKEFLPSVTEHSAEAKIFVIDNCSHDDSVSFLKQKYPEIEVVVLDRNYGFAGGYNQGLKSIDADLYCLMNNDVAVSPNWLQPIISEFDQDEKLAIAQPKILDLRRRDYFEYAGAAGGFIDKYGFPYCRGRVFQTLEKDSGQYDETSEIFWASGACLFIRKKTFDELGGFDEHFFAHMEEIDLCWRAFNRGHIIKCVGKSEVYHLGGGTLSVISPRKTFLNFRNSLFMLFKNLPSKNFLFTLFIKLTLDGIAALKFFFEAQPLHSLAVLRAHFAFYANLRRLKRMRTGGYSQKKHFKIKSVAWSYFILRIKDFKRL